MRKIGGGMVPFGLRRTIVCDTAIACDSAAFRLTLFAWMTRNTGDVASSSNLPPNAVVELGARVEV